MGLGATIVGTAYGVSTMLITNAMRKTALFQRPWEIVIAGGVGAFVANQAMWIAWWFAGFPGSSAVVLFIPLFSAISFFM